MYSVKDKVVIITGGANGIGAEIVKEFLKEDVKFVAIIDVNDVLGSNLERDLKIKYGGKKVLFFNTDVTNDTQLFEVFHKVSEEFGAIDVIVNNAAIACENSNTFKKVIEINFTALVTSTLKGLELMRKDQGGKGGTIINISSIAALSLTSPSLYVYGATKSAVLHLSSCMGMEEYFRHTNVRVLTVCFGGTKTDILKKCIGIDTITNETVNNLIETVSANGLLQPATAAAQGVVHSYKSGISGSTWLASDSKIIDITADVKDGYKIMSKHITI